LVGKHSDDGDLLAPLAGVIECLPGAALIPGIAHGGETMKDVLAVIFVAAWGAVVALAYLVHYASTGWPSPPAPTPDAAPSTPRLLEDVRVFGFPLTGAFLFALPLAAGVPGC
jgi:hypothetical protein